MQLAAGEAMRKVNLPTSWSFTNLSLFVKFLQGQCHTVHQHQQSWTLRQRSAMDRRSRRDQLPIYFYCVNEDALVESPVALPGRSDSWPREHTYGFIDLVRKVDNMGGYFCFTFPGKYFCFTCCFVNHGYTNKIIRACGQEGKTSLKDLVCAIPGLFSLLYSLP
jgi:hypothetical protein